MLKSVVGRRHNSAVKEGTGVTEVQRKQFYFSSRDTYNTLLSFALDLFPTAMILFNSLVSKYCRLLLKTQALNESKRWVDVLVLPVLPREPFVDQSGLAKGGETAGGPSPPIAGG